MEERRERKKGAEEAGEKMEGERESGEERRKAAGWEEETASINMCFKVHQLRLFSTGSNYFKFNKYLWSPSTIGKAS